MAAGLLPPLIQEFAVNASGWIAGIDEMVAANARLAESIAAISEEMKGMAASAEEAGLTGDSSALAALAASSKGSVGGTDAAAASVSAEQAKQAAAAEEAAGSEKALSDAERMAADAAKLEAEMMADLAVEQKLTADSSRLLGEAQGAQARAMAVNSEASTALQSKTSSLVASMTRLGGGVILAGTAFAAYGVKSAMDYQAQIVKLGTSAGETGSIVGGKLTGNLKVASDAILKMSVDTATSTDQLTSGMYMVESAGYHIAAGTNHAADGLNVLKVAAEGARAEQAPLADVTNSLTTVMRDFNVQPQNAAKVMNTMTVAVGQGKMTMADFAAAISHVSPLAQQAGISFGELSGAFATLTQHGDSAKDAANNLTAVIRGMENPNLQAIKEMDRMGISATEVSKDLGSRGLVGTLEMYTNAIAAHMKNGQVLINTLNNSKIAASDASAAYSKLPANVQQLAQEFLKGTITSKEWTTQLQQMPPLTANLASQWATAQKKASGFSDLLKSGSPLAQSYMQALSKMTGGTNALRAALQLTGGNLQETKANVAATNSAWTSGTSKVKGFADAQQTMKFQLQKAEAAFKAVAIVVGETLIPILMKLMMFFSEHSEITKWSAILIGAFLGLAAAMKVFSIVRGVILMVKEAAVVTKVWAAAQWLLNAAMDANPIVLIGIAIVALVAGLIYAYTHFKAFRDVVNSVFKFLKNVIGDALSWLKSNWYIVLLTLLLGPFGLAVGLIIKYWGDIKKGVMDGVHDVLNWLKSNWKVLLVILSGPLAPIVIAIIIFWKQIKSAFQESISFLKAIWNAVWPFLESVLQGFFSFIVGLWEFQWDLIKGFFVVIWDTIKVIFQIALDFFKPILSTTLKEIEAVWTTAWNLFKTIFTAAWTALRDLLNGNIKGALSIIANLPGQILKIVANFGSLLYNAGIDLINGLINGIANAANDLYSYVGNIGKWVSNTFKNVMSIFSPSKVFMQHGQMIMEGLQIGLEKATPSVLASMAKIGKDISITHTAQSMISPSASALTGPGGALDVNSLTQGSSSAGGNVNVYMTVQGTVTAERDLVSTVQQAVLRTNIRNPRNNLSLPTGQR